jgi:hypothetical protein
MRRSILIAFFYFVFAPPLFAAIGIDINQSTDRSTARKTISSPPFSTNFTNELLLAFVAADAPRSGNNTTVSSITGGSLTWVLVRRTNTQRGTAEVWRAFAPGKLTNVAVKANLSRKTAASITVVTFIGVDTSGTNGSGAVGATAGTSASSGAPTASLTTTRAGSWVFGVGNDWDNAVARAVPTNQTMVHQYLATIRDTYWVQRQASPTSTSGTVVTINDTAPTRDRYNLSIVEVLPLVGSGGSTFNVSGSITPSANGSGAAVALSQSGAAVATATADSSGSYSFADIANGTYTATPTKTGFTFSPTSQQVKVNGANITVPSFTAQGTPTSSLLYPDLSAIIPTTGTKAMRIVGTGSTREFQYTHDTFNEGPGSLVIQPAFNSASGNYQGTQYIYTYNSLGGWSISGENPVAGAFIFHAEHGHFHFPLVTFGLYGNIDPDGVPGNLDDVPGNLIVLSEKNGFCINDSFIYDPSLPHAGETGTFGSCSDPATLRGLHIGAVDEYDLHDPGQSIPIPNLANGTYWFKALADPENFLAESDKTNNETDVELTINGNTVQVLRTVIPVLNNPPTITLSSPLSGISVSGNVTLSASTETTSGVQYLLDGLPFGSIVTAAPYNLAWNTTTVPDGIHWLAAQTKDSTGIIGTSEVAMVTVNNAAGSGPIVQLTDPTANSILSATVTLYATVASSQPITSVEFFVDNGAVPVGTATASPYMISWNTTVVPDGSHVITVKATDSLGNVSNSAPVTVTVDNSHPAKTITKDIPPVFVDGQGTMTTPPFSTPTANDLLIAFLAYDGPSNSPQTGNVTGAGLTWTLLQRSNTQAGTSEIWSARANGTLSNVTVSSQPGNGSGYHGSLTVIAFTNAAGTSVVGRAGAPTGEPDIYVPGVIAGDWVFAVGNDWDRAITRTPVSGQELVHQRVDTTVGDTFWVQSTTTPSAANGLVAIHDTQPTTDQWNYAVVEVVAAH